MKKKNFFILTGVLFASLMVFNHCDAQQADSTIANQFITLNDQGKYTEAAKLMAPTFLAMVSPDNLSKIWYYHVAPHGKSHGVTAVKEMQQGKIYAVFSTCHYDNADITFAFAFDDNHQIAGFHVDNIISKENTASAPKAIYQPAGNDTGASENH